MEKSLIVRCLCAGSIGFALGLFALNSGKGSPAVEDPSISTAVVPQFRGNIGARSSTIVRGYMPKYSPAFLPTIESKPASIDEFSPDQQAFLEKKLGLERAWQAAPGPSPGFMPKYSPSFLPAFASKPKDGSSSSSYSSSSASMDGFSPDERAFLERKQQLERAWQAPSPASSSSGRPGGGGFMPKYSPAFLPTMTK